MIGIEDTGLGGMQEMDLRLNLVHEQFQVACRKYHEILVDEDDQDESEAYCIDMEKKISDIRQRMAIWFRSKELVTFWNPGIEPEDSASHVSDKSGRLGVKKGSSSTVSKLSRISSIAEVRAKDAARRAALLAEASIMEEREILDQQELNLKRRKRELKLQTELAKLDAKERAYDAMAGSRVSSMKPKSIPLIQTDRPDHNAATSGIVSVHGVDHLDSTRLQNVPLREDPVAPKPRRQDVTCKSEPNVIPNQEEYREDNQNLDAIKRLATHFAPPKSELMSFDGDPLKYFLFMRSFENSVEKDTDDKSRRLQLLIQYCSGKAKKVIESCVLLEPDEGCEEAKKLLTERFGDKFKVTNSWKRKVSDGPVIKAGDREALQDLADDLKHCEITLKAIGRLAQINNDDRSIKILERCPAFLKSRWQTKVQEIRNEDRDPNIEDVAKW